MASSPVRTFGIKSPFKPVSCVRIQIQLAPGRGNRDRIEYGDFHKHLVRAVANACPLTTHDAGKIINTVIITDHKHTGIQIIGFLIQGMKLLAALCLPYKQAVTFDLGNIKRMQRATKVKHHIVGDINKRTDRTLANRCKTPRHPVGTRSIIDAAESNTGHQRCQMRGTVKVKVPAKRAVKAALMRAGIKRFKCAIPGSSQIACDAANTKTISPVRRNRNFNYRIIQPGIGGKTVTNRCICSQFDDAVMLVRDHHLALGTQHAV